MSIDKVRRNYSIKLSNNGDHQRIRYMHFIKGRGVKMTPLNYTLRFNTIIPTANVSDIQLLNRSITLPTPSFSNRFLIKQSYMLLTWAAYISNNSTKLEKTTSRPLFAHLPIKRKRFTITKAPMAHKTFSQEQYQYQFHTVVIAFSSQLSRSYAAEPSINESIYLMLLLRQSTSRFNLGTNLLLLSKFTTRQSVSDPDFWFTGF